MNHRDQLPKVSSPEIADLSGTLRRMAKSPNDASGDYRNPNGVYLKLNNFRALDPLYRKDGRVGMSHGGKGDKIVWDCFSESVAQLSAVAKAINAAISNGELTQAVHDIAEADEGALLTRWHVYRERDTGLVKRKKKSVLAATGQLICEVCSFDFGKVYGDRGKDYIECHHRVPLHTLATPKKHVLDDFALLCANCHRMVHAKSPWLTVETLKELFSRGQVE